MNYAVDYQPIGDSVAYAWQDGGEVRRILIKGSASKAKSSPFSSPTKKSRKATKVTVSELSVAEMLGSLTPDDVLFLELGGQNDKFAIAAFRTGAKLLRLPTWHISDEQKRQREQEGRVGKDVEEPASIIHRFAAEKPESFYPFRESDLPYMEVRLLAKMFGTVQTKIRMALANKLRQIGQDLEFLGGPNGFPTTKQAIESVLMTVPAEERAEVDPKDGTAIKFFKSLEGSFKKELEAKLEELPVYKAVFEPIPGCGPGIAGYTIAAMLDIRRFPTFPKLKAYAGWHLVPNNGSGWKAAQRQRGERANWNHMLKQAGFFFAAQVNNGSPDNPWKQQLEARRIREINKLLELRRNEGKPIPINMDAERLMREVVLPERARAAALSSEGRKVIPHILEPYTGILALAHKRAMRWVVQQYFGYVYREWRRFEGLSTEPFQFGM
ncbi:MAG: transposase [Candidatus Zambryskibacteria bacterium]|nr:transposase [Candidatus Zambryskibacteria bacterium]